jgi:ATP adenylyltransferase
MSDAFEPLRRFVTTEMRMSHLYQPLMLKGLIRAGGRLTRRQIAAIFLPEDESQLEYYEQITDRMPGPALRQHKLVVKERVGYALAEHFKGLSEKCGRRHRPCVR